MTGQEGQGIGHGASLTFLSAPYPVSFRLWLLLPKLLVIFILSGQRRYLQRLDFLFSFLSPVSLSNHYVLSLFELNSLVQCFNI